MTATLQRKAHGRTGSNRRLPVRRNLWPFDSFKTSTTYHVKSKRGPTTTRAATFKGHRIERRPDGGFEVPSIERGTIFDDKRQAKRFITAQTKYNAGKKKARGNSGKARKHKAGARKRIAAAVRAMTAEERKTWKALLARPKKNLPPTPRPLKRKAQARLVKSVGEKLLRASPYGLLLNGKKRKNAGTKRNPVDVAEEVYEKFHGRPASKILKITEPVHVHSALSGIGDLKSLTIRHVGGRKKTILDFGRGAVLAQNEKRNQLFIRGGDQSVDLKVFGVEKPYHEQEILGEVLSVDYFTRKDHLAPEDGGTATYRHKFGRKKPTLIYSTPDKLLSFAGGGYTIPDEGIDL